MRRSGGDPFGRILLATAIIAVITALAGLSPARAQDITTGLVGHWKLDETSGIIAGDSSGNGYDGNFVGDPVWMANGRLGGALSFDGDDDYIKIPNSTSSLHFTEELTISFWHWTDPELMGDFSNAVVSNTHSWWGSQPAGYTITAGLHSEQTNTFRFAFYAGLGNENDGRFNVTPLPYIDKEDLPKWTHHIVTYHKTGTDHVLRRYLDGQLIEENTTALGNWGGITESSYNVNFMRAPLNDKISRAVIDDVRIYNRALTEDDIVELAAATFPGKLHYNTNYRTLEYYNGTAWHSVPKANGPSTTGLVGHWGLNEESGTFKDSSGSGNYGTQSGGVEYASSGMIGNAAGFDGTDDYIEVPDNDSLDGHANMTFGFWAKKNNTTTEGMVISKAQTSGAAYWIAMDDDGDIHYAIDQNWTSYDTNVTYPANEWIHIVLSVDSASSQSAKLYKNGILVETQSGITGSFGNVNAALQIGRMSPENTGTWYFDGRIDDVRIYGRALSATEIANLYNHGAGNLSDPCNPLNDPPLGQLCTDGSYYIGDSPADGEPVYMTSDTYENTGIRWDEDPPCYRCGLGDTGATSETDGRANTEALRAYSGDSATAGTLDGFGAVKYCDRLSAHSHDDWYLPAGGPDGSSSEINLIRETVVSAGSVGGLTTSAYYYSATEYNSNYARVQKFNDGTQGTNIKNGNRRVRCVRRGYKSPCENPLGAPGKIIYNTTHDVIQYCAAGTWQAAGPVPGAGGSGCSNPARDKGRIVYNTTYNVPQYCDGANWRAMGKPDCANIGEQCLDGSYYIGLSPADGKRVYMTSAEHESGTIRWDESPPCDRCGDGTVATSTKDGRINVEAMRAYDGESGTAAGTLDGFKTAKYCDNLTAHGHSDWYQPAAGTDGSQSEINLIWKMIDLIGAVGGINTSGVWYWASTEVSTHLAREQRFNDGTQASTNKGNSRVVRCFRR